MKNRNRPGLGYPTAAFGGFALLPSEAPMLAITSQRSDHDVHHSSVERANLNFTVTGVQFSFDVSRQRKKGRTHV